MNKNTSNALPLISPEDSGMSMTQCEAKIKELRKEHNLAIENFWKFLKSSPNPSPEWSRTQFDLYRMATQKGWTGNSIEYESPDLASSQKVLELIRNQLESTRLKKKVDEAFGSEMDSVVASVYTDEHGLTLVHRYESDPIYAISESDLDLQADEGENWFYENDFYEAFNGEASHSIASYYLIGTLHDETNEWIPKSVSPSFLFTLKQMTQTVESLVHSDMVRAHSIDTQLPSFPSGVEVSLREMEDLSVLMYKQSSQTEDEVNFIQSELDSLDHEVQDIRGQMKVLQSKLDEKTSLVNKSSLDSFLKFHNLELGQSVTQIASGVTGVIALSEGRHPKLMIKTDQDDVNLRSDRNSSGLKMEIRRGEWTSLVEVACERARDVPR